jgi:hypothetical protein
VCVNILGCVCEYFCVNVFQKKKKFTLHCAIDRTTIRSIVDIGWHLNSLEFVRAQRPTSHTHTYSSAIERTLVRSSTLDSEPSRDPF